MIEKIFKAYDVRATYPTPLNEEAAWKVGHATAQFLKRSRQNVAADQRVRMEDTVCVGRDMRPHSPDLAAALIDGIRSVGLNVIDVGMVDTSFIYFAINHLDCVGGIQTTASHNPIQYNGFKISGPKAKPIGSASGLDDIKRIAATLNRVADTGLAGKVEQMDLWQPYRQHVLQFLDLKRPLKVAIDASNGMAGKMVPAVFGGVDGLEIVPILFEITGAFTHDPNPLVESNLAMLKEKMKQVPVDLGACFDGDADRAVFLDEAGRMIGSDMATALMAKDLLKRPENKGRDRRVRPAVEPRRAGRDHRAGRRPPAGPGRARVHQEDDGRDRRPCSAASCPGTSTTATTSTPTRPRSRSPTCCRSCRPSRRRSAR
jgi:phosphomannomutase